MCCFLLCNAMSIGRFLWAVFCWAELLKEGAWGGQSKEIRAAKAALLPLTDGKIRCGRPEQGRSWDEAKTNACCRLQSRNPLQIMRCG